MENITTNYRLSTKLNSYFNKNIKFIFISRIEVIIVTKADKVYKFDVESCVLIGLSNDDLKIENALFEELCGKKIVDFANGDSHFVALTADGKLYSWGNNKYGQFRIERQEKLNKPKLVDGLADETIQSICCGYGHTLCLSLNGVVFAWGNNDWGQIGCGSERRYHSTPVKLEIFNQEKIIKISSRFNHCLALTNNGLVYSWGNNQYGQLGLGNNEDVNKPNLIDVPGVSFREISCGMRHSLLLSQDGSIYGFGCNEYNQLSKNQQTQCNFPIKIESSFCFSNIAAHF
jgi:E3 ubiquitin-protein ligase HERC4